MPQLTLTGRISHSQPVFQNLPGSLADEIAWAFERGDWSKVRERVVDFEEGRQTLGPPKV